VVSRGPGHQRAQGGRCFVFDVRHDVVLVDGHLVIVCACVERYLVPAGERPQSLLDLHVDATPARRRFPDAHGGDASLGEGAVDNLRMVRRREDEQPP
jgi:hypothetical protein